MLSDDYIYTYIYIYIYLFISVLLILVFILTDKLDGLRLNKRKRSPSPQSLEDFLQMDYFNRRSTPGKKRVSYQFLLNLILKFYP